MPNYTYNSYQRSGYTTQSRDGIEGALFGLGVVAGVIYAVVASVSASVVVFSGFLSGLIGIAMSVWISLGGMIIISGLLAALVLVVILFFVPRGGDDPGYPVPIFFVLWILFFFLFCLIAALIDKQWYPAAALSVVTAVLSGLAVLCTINLFKGTGYLNKAQSKQALALAGLIMVTLISLIALFALFNVALAIGFTVALLGVYCVYLGITDTFDWDKVSIRDGFTALTTAWLLLMSVLVAEAYIGHWAILCAVVAYGLFVLAALPYFKRVQLRAGWHLFVFMLLFAGILLLCWRINQTYHGNVSIEQGTVYAGNHYVNRLWRQKPEALCELPKTLKSNLTCLRTTENVFALLLNEDVYKEEDIDATVISALEKLDPDFAHTLATPPSDEQGHLLHGMIHLWRALQLDPTDDSGELKNELQSAVKADIRFAKDAAAYLNAHIQNRSLFDVVFSQNASLSLHAFRPAEARDYQSLRLYTSLSPLMKSYEGTATFVAHELALQPSASDNPLFILVPGGTVLSQAGGTNPVIIQQDVALVACQEGPPAVAGIYPLTLTATLQENDTFTLASSTPAWTDTLNGLAPLWQTPAKDNKDAQVYQWAIWTALNDDDNIIRAFKEHDLWKAGVSTRNLPDEVTSTLDEIEIQEVLDEEIMAYLNEIRHRSTELLKRKKSEANL